VKEMKSARSRRNEGKMKSFYHILLAVNGSCPKKESAALCYVSGNKRNAW
jgi:hypothetical protein